MGHFDVPSSIASYEVLHECCYNCAGKCDCSGSHDCQSSYYWSPSIPQNLNSNQSSKRCLQRSVSSTDKTLLKKKLTEFQRNITKNVCIEKFVSVPHASLEFNGFHILQVLSHCNELFDIADICRHI